MRVLVCGHRDMKDESLMRKELDKLHLTIRDTLIHGNARGADKLSEKVLSHVPVERYPADWEKYGLAAGPIRNTQMLVEGKPDLVIAFLHPKSVGTKDMIKQAKAAGVEVRITHL